MTQAPVPTRPETGLRSPLAWTAVLCTIGAAALGLVLALASFVLLAVIYGFLSVFTDDDPDLVGDWLGYFQPTLPGVLSFLGIVGAAGFALGAGVLLLLRRWSTVGRWAPPLQAAAAVGIVVLGWALLDVPLEVGLPLLDR